jgi:hypothetical protein
MVAAAAAAGLVLGTAACGEDDTTSEETEAPAVQETDAFTDDDLMTEDDLATEEDTTGGAVTDDGMTP